MKRCSNCGNLFPEEGTFCPACGSSSATVMLNNENAQQAEYEPTIPVPPMDPPVQQQAPGAVYGEYQPPAQQPMGQQPMGAQPMGAVNPPPKKKSSAPIIIGIVAAIVILLIILIAVSSKNGKKNEPENDSGITSSDTDTTEASEPAVSFTKGEIKDGYYLNEWADIMFPLPEGYPEAGQDVYDDLESTVIKYGFIGDKESDTGRIMVEFVMNYAISFTSGTDEGIVQEFIDELDDGDEFSAYEKGEIHTKNIGGKQYTGVVYTLPDTGFDMKLYLRTIDKHVFVLWTIGPEEEGDEFFDSITAYDPDAAATDATDNESNTIQIG